MANFTIAFERTGKTEGGYTDDPKDSGNWTGGERGVGDLIGTNAGISAPVLMKFMGRVPSVSDMKNLPDTIRKAIYRKNYWNVMRGDEINNQAQANNLYDMCVNSGCGRAIQLMQAELGVPETMQMDYTTINKLNNP